MLYVRLKVAHVKVYGKSGGARMRDLASLAEGL